MPRAGVVIVAAGLHGYFITRSRLWQSTALVVAGLFLIDPRFITDVIGAAMTGFVATTQILARRAARAQPAKQAL